MYIKQFHINQAKITIHVHVERYSKALKLVFTYAKKNFFNIIIFISRSLQIDLEQLEQEKQLKSKKDTAVQELKTTIEKEMKEEEEKMRKDLMSGLKEQLEKEREEKRKEIVRGNEHQLETVKEELQASLDKVSRHKMYMYMYSTCSTCTVHVVHVQYM